MHSTKIEIQQMSQSSTTKEAQFYREGMYGNDPEESRTVLKPRGDVRKNWRLGAEVTLC